MDNILEVSDENGTKYNIKVIDIFHVDKYPEKEYIAYTFEEKVDAENIRAYISILKETANDFSLLGISNQEEWKDAQEEFNKNMNLLIDTNNEEQA